MGIQFSSVIIMDEGSMKSCISFVSYSLSTVVVVVVVIVVVKYTDLFL